ncbi:hypothetical protein AURDEDRAFT_177736 [Auricularia subglabra TFB-10046 SS5]|uniref:Glycoside hydrolase family 31 TIM barrel domain-containing protein n=1 Tax=Auricularia subglabra (strain TFB-10046 / SS5) TaxID=717982 RepID=J0CSD1_AURST|nr:hypothetical protein AURDEDRAFT_177736 [Auricularia subglabra TFB-10046 SS5]
MEHRLNTGVFLLNSNPADILLQTPPRSDVSLIQYRFLGGVLDFYILAGPSPNSVIEQYGALIDTRSERPTRSLAHGGLTRRLVQRVDIDFYDGNKDFTNHPQNFPVDNVKGFLEELTSNNQRMIPIVDVGIKIEKGNHAHDRGVEKDVFILSLARRDYFPDWFAPNTQGWWTDEVTAWYDEDVKFEGIWLDMHEVSCELLKRHLVRLQLVPVVVYEQCACSRVKYDPKTTKRAEIKSTEMVKRADTDGKMTGRRKSGVIDFPPCAIHNGASARLISSRY